MKTIIPDGNLLILHSNRRKLEMIPASLSEQISLQILVMHTLHHDDNHAISLAIQARVQRVCKIVIGSFAGRLLQRFVGFYRIIDDDYVRSESRLRACK